MLVRRVRLLRNSKLCVPSSISMLLEISNRSLVEIFFSDVQLSSVVSFSVC